MLWPQTCCLSGSIRWPSGILFGGIRWLYQSAPDRCRSQLEDFFLGASPMACMMHSIIYSLSCWGILGWEVLIWCLGRQALHEHYLFYNSLSIFVCRLTCYALNTFIMESLTRDSWDPVLIFIALTHHIDNLFDRRDFKCSLHFNYGVSCLYLLMVLLLFLLEFRLPLRWIETFDAGGCTLMGTILSEVGSVAMKVIILIFK